MNNKEIKLPTTVLFAFTLINLCLIGVILFLGQSIIIPIVLSLLIAILLRPIVVFFNRKCWNVVSITLHDLVKSNMVAKKLDTTVNSIFREMGPLVSPDGKTLYFSRRGDPKNQGGTEDEEDIWFSEWDAKY